MSKKETFEKFLKFMEKWHYEDFNAFETHFNKLLSMKGREQLTNENEALKDIIAVILAQKKNVNEQIDQIQQQLAEKDKEIERFMSMKNKEQLVNENEALKDTIAIVLAQKRNIVKHKKQLAIQELEKVIDYIKEHRHTAQDNRYIVYVKSLKDQINKQIKELKGEKDVED